MNRTLRTIIGAVLILVITFAAISICQQILTHVKLDVTEQKIFTLSDGTKSILSRLNQPLQAELYYAKTAAMEAQDSIKFFNNYNEFVKALLQEYVRISNGMIQLEVIDPRPYSPEEEDALRYGLKRFPINDEENFFFGLVIKTQFGVEKTIPFFSPDRQNFVEYDISYLIDTAITREKKRVGVMSSLPVMGEDLSGYMAQMKQMQGQEIQQPWSIVSHMRQQFEVETVPTDINSVDDINDIDILLVVHPKDLPERTQFALDQYILKGGRAILCVDPYCYEDRPASPQMQMQAPPDQSSNLPSLLKAWGLELQEDAFTGDLNLALPVPLGQNQRPEPFIGLLGLTQDSGCFNLDHVISGELQQVRTLFAGALKEIPQGMLDPNDPAPVEDIQRMPLVHTTAQGNTVKINSPYDFYNLAGFNKSFTPGAQPVNLAYLVSGKLPSAFPNGIKVDVEKDDPNDPNETITVTESLTGLPYSEDTSAVVVFADVDFMSNNMAYQQSIFGSVVVGDNAALLINAIEDLCGSSDLISIRSRGNFRREFLVVKDIEKEAEAETAQKVEELNAQIQTYNQELQNLINSAQDGDQAVIGSAIVDKRRELEVKIRKAQSQLNEVKLQRRERIEDLGNRLRQFNMLAAPAVILMIAIVLGIRRSMRKRHYISHRRPS